MKGSSNDLCDYSKIEHVSAEFVVLGQTQKPTRAARSLMLLLISNVKKSQVRLILFNQRLSVMADSVKDASKLWAASCAFPEMITLAFSTSVIFCRKSGEDRKRAAEILPDTLVHCIPFSS